MLNTKSIKNIIKADNNEKRNDKEKEKVIIFESNTESILNMKKNDDNIIESIIILNEDIGPVNKPIVSMKQVVNMDSVVKLCKNNIIFDDNKNAFIINDDNVIYTILKSDIINYIINLSTNEAAIKKYIFIISFNNITNNNEFNFIANTIFTNNLNMMIKLQNLIYENINRDDFSCGEQLMKNKFLMFFYQLIIFMFKTTYDNNIYDKYKIINTYSTLSFRISSIILRETFFLQNKYENVSQELENVNNIKNNLHLKLNKLSKQINIIEEDTENISSENKNEETTQDSNKSVEKIENLIDSITSSINKMESNKISSKKSLNDNKSNNKSNNEKVSKNLLNSLDFNTDEEYAEIDGETSEPSNNYINDLMKISSMSNSTQDNSYNSKSAINNGKIYFNK